MAHRDHRDPAASTDASPTSNPAPAPGKVAATSRLQRKPAEGAAVAPPPGADFDDPQTGGQSRADDPFGLHLGDKGDDGPPGQSASDRIEVRINGGGLETWMLVKVVDATTFVARDPQGGLHRFSKGAVSHDEERWQGEGRPRSKHRVHDVLLSPASLAERTKGAVGRTWHYVQRGFQWIEEQETGKTRGQLDAEEAERDGERNSKAAIGVRG